MGDANRRGTREQRVAEATARTKAEAVARAEKKAADHRARMVAFEAREAEREHQNAERLEQGEEPLPPPTPPVRMGGRRAGMKSSQMVMVAALAAIAGIGSL